MNFLLLNNLNNKNDKNNDLIYLKKYKKLKKLYFKNLNFYTRANFNITQRQMNFYIFKIFVGKLTKKGKKLSAFNFVYQIFLKLRNLSFNKYFEFNFLDGAALFFKAIKLLIPVIKIIKKKVSGNILNLPTPLFKPKNAITIAIKNLLINSLKRKEKNLINKILLEIKDTLNKKSDSYLIKLQHYKVGTNNIPFINNLNIKKQRIKYNDFIATRLKKTRPKFSLNLPKLERKKITLTKFKKFSQNVNNILEKDIYYVMRSIFKKRQKFYKIKLINNNKKKKGLINYVSLYQNLKKEQEKTKKLNKKNKK